MSHLPPHQLKDEKQKLRDAMLARRTGHADNHPATFKKLADLFVRNLKLPPGAVVSAYRAFRDEMDPHPLTEALRAQGHKIALPVVIGKGQALAFRLYEPGDVLSVSKMGLHEPLAASPAVEPDVLIVPLLAFDAQRNRLGYGGGFYDRTIADLCARKPVMAIGVAYAYQQVPQVPAGPGDRRLDRIVTELNIL